MNRSQLEARVLELVATARRGARVEDDAVEVKSIWPDPKSKGPRQLAGAANRARGDDLVYVIGLDETDGSVKTIADVDIADWWQQMTARFDDVAPYLIHQLVVQVDDKSSVTALLLGTDRAPYLIRGDGDRSHELEIPMREGTRTRSARRREVISMLNPQVRVPEATVLEARVIVDWLPKSTHGIRGSGERVDEEHFVVSGDLRVWLDHMPGPALTLPAHEMAIALTAGPLQWTTRLLPVAVQGTSFNPVAPARPSQGVEAFAHGVVATAPGRFDSAFKILIDGDLPGAHETFGDLDEWTLNTVFAIAGADIPLRLTTVVRRVTHSDRNDLESAHEVGAWRFNARRRFRPLG